MADPRTSLPAFADLIRRPMTAWQADGLRLERRITCIVSPRQCGKSRSLATLAVWWAYTRPTSLVLIVSAGEDAALRLLAEVRDVVTGTPMLAGSVVDERAASVRLSNGSEIKSVPASEKAIRGHRVGLLLVDEATQVGEDILQGAALPTTAAQPGSRIVLASSPLGAMGPFYEMASAGEAGDLGVATFRWRRADATWIDSAMVEVQRRSMSPQRFRAEWEGEFVLGSGDFIDVEEILAVREDSAPEPRVLFPVGGVDPAFARDLFGVAVIGRAPGGLDTVAFVDGWRAQGVRDTLARAASVFRRFGVSRVGTDQFGAAAVEESFRRDHRISVVVRAASRSSNMQGYLDLRRRLLDGTLEVPRDPELLRELGALRTKLTDSSEQIVSPRTRDGHGDRVSAVVAALAVYGGGGPSVQVTSYRPRVGEAVMVGDGDLVLHGEHHLDVGPAGELCAPGGTRVLMAGGWDEDVVERGSW